MATHKFTIEIELENAKSCTDCPLIYSINNPDTWMDSDCIFGFKGFTGNERPQECIDKYGTSK